MKTLRLNLFFCGDFDVSVSVRDFNSLLAFPGMEFGYKCFVLVPYSSGCSKSVIEFLVPIREEG